MLSKARQFLEGETAKKWKAWYTSWLPSQTTVFSPDRCCLRIGRDKIDFLHARKTETKTELLLAETLPYKDLTEIKAILSELRQKQGLETPRCSWILLPEQYQLLPTEALPVASQEFQGAIRWKIKHLLSFPVEDAIIDSFPLPQVKSPTALKTIMLVIARLSLIKPIVDQIIASDFHLTTIDIPELSFRNFTAWYEKDEKSSALIYLEEDKSNLIVTNQQQLYFSRQLNFGLQSILSSTPHSENQAPLEEALNAAALDIQRSFDFYQSQWRLPEPGRVFVATALPSALDIALLLSKRLNITVKPMDLAAYFNNQNAVNIETSGYFLPLLGEFLRE